MALEGKVRGSPKRVRFVLWGPWLSIQNFMAIHLMVVRIWAVNPKNMFHSFRTASERKVLSDSERLPQLPPLLSMQTRRQWRGVCLFHERAQLFTTVFGVNDGSTFSTCRRSLLGGPWQPQKLQTGEWRSWFYRYLSFVLYISTAAENGQINEEI